MTQIRDLQIKARTLHLAAQPPRGISLHSNLKRTHRHGTEQTNVMCISEDATGPLHYVQVQNSPQ
jgi:hypothetical protein